MSSEWAEVSLDDIADLNGGYAFKSEEYTETGHFVLRTVNITDDGRISRDGGAYVSPASSKKYERFLLKDLDTLFVMVGATLGKTGLVKAGDLPALLNQNMWVVRAKTDRVDPLFLHYAFKVISRPMCSLASGSARGFVKRDDFRQMKLRIPEILVQREISGLLGAIDDRITLLRETNTTLEAIAQALFKSWFVDFDPVHAKMQGRAPEGMDEATAALFPDSFEESELGNVPKGWSVGPIGESIAVVDFVANGSFAALKQNVTLENTPSYALYLRTTDFNSQYSGDFRYVNESAYKFLSKSSLDGTEVIISNVGDVGTVFRPPTWLGLPMTLGSNAVALKSRGHSAFMYLYFSGAKGQHDISSIVTGSAQLKFNKTNFRSLKIALPDAVTLECFENIVGALLSKIDTNLATAQKLSTLRDTLLPRLISGQIDLNTL